MSAQERRMICYPSPGLIKQIKDQKIRTGESVSEIICEAIKQYYANKNSNKKPAQ